MAAVQNEHPNFAMFENCANQLLRYHDFFNHASVGISNWLQIYSNHDKSIAVIEGSQMRKALSAAITVLNENHTGKSALISMSWAGKNCKRDTETRPIVLPEMALQINV